MGAVVLGCWFGGGVVLVGGGCCVGGCGGGMNFLRVCHSGRQFLSTMTEGWASWGSGCWCRRVNVPGCFVL